MSGSAAFEEFVKRHDPTARPRNHMNVVKAALGLVVLVVTACGGSPGIDRMRADTEQLAAVLPVLEELRLVEFRSQDWCRTLAYAGGLYFESDEDACVLFAGPGGQFDEPAETAFAQVGDALEATGLSIYMVDATYASDGSLSDASFTIETGFSIPFEGAHAYVYNVHQPAMEDDDPVDTKIDDHWHLAVSDWN
jgi:hypothetical protein